MMDTATLIKRPANRRPPQIVQLGELAIDASLDETHSMTSKVTQYPIESGSVISDHVINNPVTVSIHGVVTNNTIRDEDEQEEVRIGDERKVGEAYDFLISIRDSKEPITILTGLSNYQDMVLTSLSIPRSRSTGEVLEFTAEFTQVKIVRSMTLSYTDLLAIAKVDKVASKKVDVANVTPPTVDANSPGASIAKTTLNALGFPLK